MHLCKYVMHLILHLEECIQDCGPPLLFSQYWVERYIEWIVGRLNAQKLAAESLFRSALAGEAHKVYFKVPFVSENRKQYEEVEMESGFMMREKGFIKCFSEEDDGDRRFLGLMKNFFCRKYEGMWQARLNDFLQPCKIVCSVHAFGSFAGRARNMSQLTMKGGMAIEINTREGKLVCSM